MAKYFDFKSGQLVDKPTDTKLQVLPNEDKSVPCDICKSVEKDDKKFGHFFRNKYASCHYFCLLLTPEMTQSARDTAGILGFERIDILNSRQAVASNLCHYCNRKSANLNCAHKDCKRRFHLVCGYNQNCQFDFESYTTYCHDHVTVQHPDSLLENFERCECMICWETMKPYSPTTCIVPRCCYEGWLHRRCLQAYADNAGYSFLCPLCENEDKTFFKNDVRKLGIFVWDRMASWEFEGRYVDIDKMKCTAEKCHMGVSKLNFLKCRACGHKVGHAKCFGVKESEIDGYTCKNCFEKTFLNLIPD